MIVNCPKCKERLVERDSILTCPTCATQHATVENGIICFKDCVDEHNYFVKRAHERLDNLFAGYDRQQFLDSLDRIQLWEMDNVNQSVGIVTKFWWEECIGKITGKSVLEVGCGINYIVPYFLESGNSVFAFDICKENVGYTRKILNAIGAPQERLTLAVADAREISFSEKFDVIDISNVLHHIDDRVGVLSQMRESLADDGKLIIVEPNYYYPPRWLMETDIFGKNNFIHRYFVRNDFIEIGEKAIIFKHFRKELEGAGFRIDHYYKDYNFLGYSAGFLLKEQTFLKRLIFLLDYYLLGRLLPRIFASFEYIIASKA